MNLCREYFNTAIDAQNTSITPNKNWTLWLIALIFYVITHRSHKHWKWSSFWSTLCNVTYTWL